MAKGNRNGKKRNGKKISRVPRTQLAQRNGAKRIAASSGPVIEVTDRTFEQVVEQSDVPVLVDFWAPWCGPCKAVAPILESIAEERKGEIKVVKYNTEANSQIASELAVRSIPTLALFKDGEVADVKIGASSKAALATWIDHTLNPKPGLLSRLFGWSSTTAARVELVEEETDDRRVARKVIKITWPFRLGFTSRTPSRDLDYGTEAKAVMHLASSLSQHYCRSSLTPELLLYALLQDEDVLAAVSPSEEDLEKLEADAVTIDDREKGGDGWSLRAKMALYTAWNRAERRGRCLVTRGDLISGLAGMGGVVGPMLVRADVDYDRLDRDQPRGWLAALPEVADGKDDEKVWVIVLNDEVTTMEFVIEVEK